jgi:hypothetical protein
MLVKPAAPRPISAGIHPELDCSSWIASTLKFAKALPPISGSLVSAPSMAKTASTPRWPLIANCWVKFVAPLTSVMVPAASNSNVLKSRPFSGRELTDSLDSFSPPEVPDPLPGVPPVAFPVVLPVPTVPAPALACAAPGLPATSGNGPRVRALLSVTVIVTEACGSSMGMAAAPAPLLSLTSRA